MITLKNLELKIEAVAAEIGVEARHLLTVLHDDLDKLIHHAKADATVVPRVLAKAETARAAIVAGAQEVHADVVAEVAKVDAVADKVVADVETLA